MTEPSLVSETRYTPVAQALHWLVALLVFLTVPLAWVMVNMPSTAHLAGQLFTLHESIGLTTLIIVAARLIWRARHPAPPLPQSFARWDRLAARVSHWLLYVILIGMPASGYLMNAAGGYPVGFFWLFDVPDLPKAQAVSDFAFRLHVVIGQWLLYGLARFSPARWRLRAHAAQTGDVGQQMALSQTF
jgi:cytochrome b561